MKNLHDQISGWLRHCSMNYMIVLQKELIDSTVYHVHVRGKRIWKYTDSLIN